MMSQKKLLSNCDNCSKTSHGRVHQNLYGSVNMIWGKRLSTKFIIRLCFASEVQPPSLGQASVSLLGACRSNTSHLKSTFTQLKKGLVLPRNPSFRPCQRSAIALHENDSTPSSGMSLQKMGAFHVDDATRTSAEAVQKYFANEIIHFHSCGVTTLRPPRLATQRQVVTSSSFASTVALGQSSGNL